MIVTCSEDETVVLWDTNGNKFTTLHHNGPVESVAFSSDGSKIITGSWDHTVKVWETNGNLLRSLELPYEVNVRSVTFSPDDKKIFIGASDGIGRLFDTRSLQEFLKSDDIDVLTAEQKDELGLK